MQNFVVFFDKNNKKIGQVQPINLIIQKVYNSESLAFFSIGTVKLNINNGETKVREKIDNISRDWLRVKIMGKENGQIRELWRGWTLTVTLKYELALIDFVCVDFWRYAEKKKIHVEKEINNTNALKVLQDEWEIINNRNETNIKIVGDFHDNMSFNLPYGSSFSDIMRQVVDKGGDFFFSENEVIVTKKTNITKTIKYNFLDSSNSDFTAPSTIDIVGNLFLNSVIAKATNTNDKIVQTLPDLGNSELIEEFKNFETQGVQELTDRADKLISERSGINSEFDLEMNEKFNITDFEIGDIVRIKINQGVSIFNIDEDFKIAKILINFSNPIHIKITVSKTKLKESIEKINSIEIRKLASK